MQVKNIEDIKFDAGKTETGKCPVCVHDEIEYGSYEFYDNGGAHNFICGKCGTTGLQYEKYGFDGYLVYAAPEWYDTRHDGGATAGLEAVCDN